MLIFAVVGHMPSLWMRRMILGSTGKLTPDQARTLAKKMLGAVAQGADPAIEKAAEKPAETLQDLANLFLTEHVDPTRSRKLVTDALAC